MSLGYCLFPIWPVRLVKQCIKRFQVTSIVKSNDAGSCARDHLLHLSPLRWNNVCSSSRDWLLPKPPATQDKQCSQSAQPLSIKQKKKQRLPVKTKDVHRVPRYYYLNCLSVRRDDAEGTRGRPGACGAAGADCCHGNSGRCRGESDGRNPTVTVLLLLSIHLPGDTDSVMESL